MVVVAGQQQIIERVGSFCDDENGSSSSCIIDDDDDRENYCYENNNIINNNNNNNLTKSEINETINSGSSSSSSRILATSNQHSCLVENKNNNIRTSENDKHENMSYTNQQQRINKKKRCNSNSNRKMVIGPEDLVRIRQRIGQIYVKQNVIVAPCLSKLYLSHDESNGSAVKHLPACGDTNNKDDDSELDWFYFGMGLVAIIYDPEKNDVKMTMFERNDVRLVWSLKWTDIVRVAKPAPNFHILNSMTENGKSQQHVGILYENRDVAELVSQTITLIYDRIKISRQCDGNDSVDSGATTTTIIEKEFKSSQGSDSTAKPNNNNNNNNKETASLTVVQTDGTMSLQRKQPKRLFERSNTLKDALFARHNNNNNKSLELDMLQRRNLRSATVHEFSTNGGRDTKIRNDFKRDELLAAENRPRSECCEQTSRLLKLSRADSFRKSRSSTFDSAMATTKSPTTTTIYNKSKSRSLGKSFDEAASRGKDNLVKILFKKRRISRTQSLQVEDRKIGHRVEQQPQECSGGSSTHGDSSKQYERPVRLVKPRASTDTMLLCDSMRTLFEAGIAARNERERKNWMRTLRNKDAQSTDLCVTEL